MPRALPSSVNMMEEGNARGKTPDKLDKDRLFMYELQCIHHYIRADMREEMFDLIKDRPETMEYKSH